MKENRYRHVQLCRQLWGENWGYSGPCRRCLWEYTWELVIWRHVDLRRCANNLSNIVTAHCKSAWRKMMSSQVYSQRLKWDFMPKWSIACRLHHMRLSSAPILHVAFAWQQLPPGHSEGNRIPPIFAHMPVSRWRSSPGSPSLILWVNQRTGATVRVSPNTVVFLPVATDKVAVSAKAIAGWVRTYSHVYWATATPILYFCRSNEV